MLLCVDLFAQQVNWYGSKVSHFIYSCNLLQSEACPTHKHGPIIVWCVLVFNMSICDAVFSDHIPFLFEILLFNMITLRIPACRCGMLNPSVAVQFLAAFTSNTNIQFLVCFCFHFICPPWFCSIFIPLLCRRNPNINPKFMFLWNKIILSQTNHF